MMAFEAKDAISQEDLCVMIVTTIIRNNSSGGDFVERIELELKADNGKSLRTSHPPPIESPPGMASARIGDGYHPVFPWSERLAYPLFIPEKPGEVRGKVAFSISLRQFPQFNPFSPSGPGFSWRVNAFGRNSKVWPSRWYAWQSFASHAS
jgi:hypothetical protein